MKKFSIIIEISDNFDNISRCIESVINQSFNDFDIIIINPYNNSNIISLLFDYKKRDNRISVINDSELNTIHDVRVRGLLKSESEYILFIKSDDYFSCDYIRIMYENIMKFNSDINIASYVVLKDNEKIIYPLTNSYLQKDFDSDNMLSDYFESCGYNNRLYKIELKCFSNKVIKSIIKKYGKMHIISELEDDITFSSMLYIKSKKISYVNSCEYFMNYYEDDISSIKFNDLKKYLEQESLGKYIKQLDKWNKNNNIFYSVQSMYNESLEIIKKDIIADKNEVISFDIFDTLVVRPFYQAFDLFELMDKEFINISCSNPIIKFSKMRKDSEATLRKINLEKGVEEVKITDIYNYIQKKYSISSLVIQKMKKFEENLEIRFCSVRKTGYDLYNLAKFLKKRVIIISDMYLSKKIINEILKKNGYFFDKIYLSSELLKTKNSGSLFEFVKENEKCNILHIGDNLHSDIEMAKNNNINTAYLPRTIDVFMGKTNIKTNNCGGLYTEFDMYNINMDAYLKNSGVRSSLAIVANKYFDNPFKNFVDSTKFNSDPFLIGYYGLGMHLLSLSNWILKDTKLKEKDSISFMSRDGYLPLKSTKILQNNTNINKKILLNYMYISRKAVLPLIFSDKKAINIFQTYIDYTNISPEELYETLETVLNDYNKKDFLSVIDKNNIKAEHFKTIEDFFECLTIIYENFFDKNKYDNYFKITKEYFQKNFMGDASIFDIGYSGKMQALLSFIINKPISTYFYHTVSSEAYSNSYLSDYELNTFYDFMPMLTGTIRELFYSDISPTCVGFEKKKSDIVPIFGTAERYTYFNKKMLQIIQSSSLQFVEDFSKTFAEYFEFFDLNRFYMSIPYEFFNHYISEKDRVIFKDLIFESNVNDSKIFMNYVDGILNTYNYFNCELIKKIVDNNYNEFKPFLYEKFWSGNNSELKEKMRAELKEELYQEIGETVKSEIIKNGYGVLPKKRILRFLYYLIFDKNKLKEIIKKYKK